MILGEGVRISVGEFLLTRKINTPGSYYLLVNNDPGNTYFRGVIIDGYHRFSTTDSRYSFR